MVPAPHVWFLARRLSPFTEPWWLAMREREDMPLVVRDLGSRMEIVAAPAEIAAALVWARTVDGWDEAHPALVGHDGSD